MFYCTRCSTSPSPSQLPAPCPAWPHLPKGQLHLQVPLEIVLGHGFSILQHLVGWGLEWLGDFICRQHLREEKVQEELSLGINWAQAWSSWEGEATKRQSEQDLSPGQGGNGQQTQAWGGWGQAQPRGCGESPKTPRGKNFH